MTIAINDIDLFKALKEKLGENQAQMLTEYIEQKVAKTFDEKKDLIATKEDIHSIKDDERYYIEADMRPNVWVDYGKYIGNDASISIGEYFINGKLIKYPQVINPKYPDTLLIPYTLRLSFFDFILNKYKCWQYIEVYSQGLIFIVNFIDGKLITLSIRFIKTRVSHSVWLKLKWIHQQIVIRLLNNLR